MKKQYDTPDCAIESFDIGRNIISAYQAIPDDEDKVDIIDRLFGLQLQSKGLETYSPGNIPSQALLAMDSLNSVNRPNSVLNLLKSLNGGSMSLNRMPYPLIESNLQFFASHHVSQVRVAEPYRKWLATMYAHFGEKFLALYCGPMWKVDQGGDDDDAQHHQILEQAFRDTDGDVVPDTDHHSAQQRTSTPDGERKQHPSAPTCTPVQSAPASLCDRPSTLWRKADQAEIKASQEEGVSATQRERELLEHHGIKRTRNAPSRIYRATEDVRMLIIFCKQY